MLNTDKRQFLDPISSISKIILLYFSSPKTKLRVGNNTIQLESADSTIDTIYRTYNNLMPSFVSNSNSEGKRENICKLYPIIIRFIKLYLMVKQKRLTSKQSNTPQELASTALVKKTSDFDSTNRHTESDRLSYEGEINDEMCYEYLKKIACYAIVGMRELQKTYHYDNAVFALNYYITLLEQGMNQTYTDALLPAHLKNLMDNNLVDDRKLQKLWQDSHIIEIGRTFEKCFEAKEKNDEIMLEANKEKLLGILKKKDEIFQKMVSTDNA